MINLREIASLGETFNSFSETKRWDVIDNDLVIGQIWRAKRSDDVICWMVKPAAIRFSIPQSSVVGGYRATTKKGAVAEIAGWHANSPFNHDSSGWTLHCYRRWHASDYRGGNDQDRYYLAIHPENGQKWVSVSFIDTHNTNMGLMGVPGWHASGYRGDRMVVVYQAATPEEALDTLIDNVSLPPSPEDYNKPFTTGSPSVERIFGALALRVSL